MSKMIIFLAIMLKRNIFTFDVAETTNKSGWHKTSSDTLKSKYIQQATLPISCFHQRYYGLIHEARILETIKLTIYDDDMFLSKSILTSTAVRH